MDEVWKNIKGYNGVYQVSNMGRVRSIKILKGTVNSSGHHCIRIGGKNHLLHRLVLITFNGFDSDPDRCVVNHLNSNKSDNTIENLEWCTYSENQAHSSQYGKRWNPLIEKKDQVEVSIEIARDICKLFREGLFTRKELAQRFNIPIKQIFRILDPDSYNFERKQGQRVSARGLKRMD